MRTLALLLISTLSASADVLVLKDGRKIAGQIKETPESYEIRLEGETLVFGKDEVEKWVRNPKELTAEAEPLIEEAKQLYLDGTKDSKNADAKFREALPKVQKARDIYGEARELFPEGHADLDEALANVMKLMRLVRERLGSQITGASSPVKPKPEPKPDPKPEPKPEPKKEPPPSMALVDALAILRERRHLPEERKRASEFFRRYASEGKRLTDFAAASFIYLSKDDRDWRIVLDKIDIQGPNSALKYAGRLVKKSDRFWTLHTTKGQEVQLRKADDGWHVTPPGVPEFKAVECKIQEGVASGALEALEEYLHSIAELETFTDPRHLEAARFLSSRVKALRTENPNTPVDMLVLYCGGHVSEILASDLGTVLQDLGWQKGKESSAVGTREGLAVAELQKWLSSGEYELGSVQANREYRAINDFAVKYVHGFLLLANALAKGRQFDKAYLFLESSAKQFPGRPAAHLQALAKSVRAVALCKVCGGTAKIRCNICRGKGKADFQCKKCGGSGRVIQAFGGGEVACNGCAGKGTFKDAKCPKCKATGQLDCKAKGCDKPRSIPKWEDVVDAYACPLCRSSGTLLSNVALVCPDCFGLGMFLTPKADPAKTLR